MRYPPEHPGRKASAFTFAMEAERVLPGSRLFVALLMMGWSHVFAAASLPRIDVPGVIQITRITQPNENDLLGGKLGSEISPDEKHFFLITRKQDLKLNKNIYRLVLYDIDAAAGGAVPQEGRVLVEAYSSGNFVIEHAIRAAKWLDNHTIIFLAEFEDHPTQVFTVDIRSRATRQLTYHPTPVLGFVFEPRAGVVVYVAREPVDNSDMQRASFVAGNRTLTQILFPDDLTKQQLFYRYYRSRAGRPASIQALGNAFRMGRLPPLMSLSPNGQWVITRSTPDTLAASVRLANAYAPLREIVSRYLLQEEDPESLFTEHYSSALMRMRIFDVNTGEEMPWFDVPDATSIGREWPFAHWMPDGESVVIANTYLPLDGVDEAERRRRSSTPALIEYWPRTGRFRKISDLSNERMAFQGLYPVPSLPEAVVVKEQGRLMGFRRKDGAWIRDDTLARDDGGSGKVRGRLLLQQSADEPPDIHYRRPGGELVKVTDLNPQLREVDIGRAEPFAWQDSSGREWRGGLLVPSDFDETRRYPLVIQLYGFSEEQFYIDGPRYISSAMAGRAYLREDILVLAFPNKSGPAREELHMYADGVKSAITRLATEGVIDPDRVGIVGFSGMGFIAQHMITFADVKLRAATLADAGQSSLFSLVAYLYGFYKPGMLFLEDRLQAKPWGERALEWARRDPALHTDCIEAAVRYEFNGLYPPQGWDSYALLRRQYKPVEAIFFPRGFHQLRRPQERLDSLQGNVDWFRFWLKDEQDSDPAKAAQYERWSAMKKRAPRVVRHAGCTLSE